MMRKPEPDVPPQLYKSPPLSPEQIRAGGWRVGDYDWPDPFDAAEAEAALVEADRKDARISARLPIVAAGAFVGVMLLIGLLALVGS